MGGYNNLRLNRAKSKEIIFTARGKRGKLSRLPPPCLSIERVSTLRVLALLGVIINDRLTATDQVNNLLSTSVTGISAYRQGRMSDALRVATRREND